MRSYDVDNSGTIEAFDLGKVIKKLGIMNPEPHISTIIKLGGCSITEKRIPCIRFATELQNQLAKRTKDSSSTFERVMQKLVAILRTRDITIFEFFVMLDVNMSGKASQLEVKTGIQHLGLNMSAAEFACFWDAVYKK